VLCFDLDNLPVYLHLPLRPHARRAVRPPSFRRFVLSCTRGMRESSTHSRSGRRLRLRLLFLLPSSIVYPPHLFHSTPGMHESSSTPSAAAASRYDFIGSGSRAFTGRDEEDENKRRAMSDEWEWTRRLHVLQRPYTPLALHIRRAHRPSFLFVDRLLARAPGV
jgi:hypothetical protein